MEELLLKVNKTENLINVNNEVAHAFSPRAPVGPKLTINEYQQQKLSCLRSGSEIDGILSDETSGQVSEFLTQNNSIVTKTWPPITKVQSKSFNVVTVTKKQEEALVKLNEDLVELDPAVKGFAERGDLDSIVTKIATSFNKLENPSEVIAITQSLAESSEVLTLVQCEPRLAAMLGFTLYLQTYMTLHKPDEFQNLLFYVKEALEKAKAAKLKETNTIVIAASNFYAQHRPFILGAGIVAGGFGLVKAGALKLLPAFGFLPKETNVTIGSLINELGKRATFAVGDAAAKVVWSKGVIVGSAGGAWLEGVLDALGRKKG